MIRELITAGKSGAEVRDAVMERYGVDADEADQIIGIELGDPEADDVQVPPAAD